MGRSVGLGLVKILVSPEMDIGDYGGGGVWVATKILNFYLNFVDQSPSGNRKEHKGTERGGESLWIRG